MSANISARKTMSSGEEDATHVRVEIYIPDYGWIGIDPTNNCIAPDKHVRIAVGRFLPKKSPYGTHEGYYWLGYEWSNLLLVCQRCNNKKSSHFPIADQTLRLNSHSVDFAGNIIFLITDTVYQNEGHILLNPEIDTVEDYFIFKPNGEIAGIDPEGRGALSIKLYGLQRERLVLGRKKIADDFFDEIKEALVRYDLSEINENSLIDILNLKFNTLRNKSQNKTLQYSRVWYFLYNKFEIFAREYLTNQGDYDLIVARFNIFSTL